MRLLQNRKKKKKKFNPAVGGWRYPLTLVALENIHSHWGGGEGCRGRKRARKREKFPPDWSSHGLPCRRVSRFLQ